MHQRPDASRCIDIRRFKKEWAMRVITWAALAIVPAMAISALADWPQFMGPTGDGIAPETEKVTKLLPEGGPRELWKIAVANGFSSPAVAGGKVYLLDRPDGGAKEVFTVLDLATGKEEWSVTNDSQPFRENYGTTRGTPAVDGKMAYSIGVTGDLLAVDLDEKKIAWKKNIEKDFAARAGGWGFAMSPVVLRDLLIVDTPGSRASGIVALDKKTGEKKWASPSFGASDTYTTPIVIKLNDVEQLVAWHKGVCAGVSTSDGKLLWQYKWKTDRPIPNPVYLGDGRFFLTVGYGGGVSIIDVKAGDNGYEVTETLKDEQLGSKVSNATFYKGFIYSNASDRGLGLMCLDREGKTRWQSTQKFGMGSMIIADDTIFMMNGDNGTLFTVEASPAGYKELSKAKVLQTNTVWGPLALSDGKLLVRDKKTLKCLDVSAK
jgi:outer membrane protein assembly factor BamB